MTRTFLLLSLVVALLAWGLAGRVTAQAPPQAAPQTEVTIYPAADSYLASNRPDQNFGDSTGLLLGYSIGSENYGAERMLLRFELTDIVPSDATINNARLVLYLNSAIPKNDVPMQTTLRRLNSAWDETTVTWNSEPQWGPIRAQAEVGSAPGPYAWDVTSLVRDWVRGTVPNHGVEIQGDEHVQQRERLFYARESQSNLEPRLIVDFTTPPSDTEPPTVVVEALADYVPRTFTVSWQGTDAGGSGIDHYDVRYRMDDGAWTLWLGETEATSGTFTGADGHRYEFEARGVDNAGNVEAFREEAEADTLVDEQAPTATVLSLPAVVGVYDFVVSWEADDGDGSGVACYDVQVRRDAGPWTLWQSCTTATSALFSAPADGTYAFEARARDNADNTESFENAAETSVIVDAQPPYLSEQLWLPLLFSDAR